MFAWRPSLQRSQPPPPPNLPKWHYSNRFHQLMVALASGAVNVGHSCLLVSLPGGLNKPAQAAAFSRVSSAALLTPSLHVRDGAEVQEQRKKKEARRGGGRKSMFWRRDAVWVSGLTCWLVMWAEQKWHACLAPNAPAKSLLFRRWNLRRLKWFRSRENHRQTRGKVSASMSLLRSPGPP